MNKLLTLCTFVFFITAMYGLLSGSGILSVQLPGGLLFGNLLAALCLLAPSMLLYFLMRDSATFKRLRTTAFIGALLWLPISLLLAGNVNLVFADFRFTLWAIYSLLLSICVFVVIAHSVIYYLSIEMRRRGKAGNIELP